MFSVDEPSVFILTRSHLDNNQPWNFPSSFEFRKFILSKIPIFDKNQYSNTSNLQDGFSSSDFYSANQDDRTNIFSFKNAGYDKRLAFKLSRIQMRRLGRDINTLTSPRADQQPDIIKNTLNEGTVIKDFAIPLTGSVLGRMASFISDTHRPVTAFSKFSNRLDLADRYFKEQIIADSLLPLIKDPAEIKLLSRGVGRKNLIDFYRISEELVNQNLQKYVEKNAKKHNRENRDGISDKGKVLSESSSIYRIENGKKIIDIDGEEKELFYNSKTNVSEIQLVDLRGNEHRFSVFLDENNNWFTRNKEQLNIIKYKLFIGKESLPKGEYIEHNILKLTTDSGENGYFAIIENDSLLSDDLIEIEKYRIGNHNVYCAKHPYLERKVITKKANGNWHFEQESTRLGDNIQVLLSHIYGNTISNEFHFSEIKNDGFCYDEHNNKYIKYKNKYYEVGTSQYGHFSLHKGREEFRLKKDTNDAFEINDFSLSKNKRSDIEAAHPSPPVSKFDNNNLTLTEKFNWLESEVTAFIKDTYDPILDPILFINDYTMQKIRDNESRIGKITGLTPQSKVKASAIYVAKQVNTVQPIEYEPSLIEIATAPDYYQITTEYSDLINIFKQENLHEIMSVELAKYKIKLLKNNELNIYYQNMITLRCVEFLGNSHYLEEQKKAVESFLAERIRAEIVNFHGIELAGTFAVPVGKESKILFGVNDPSVFIFNSFHSKKHQSLGDFSISSEFSDFILSKISLLEKNQYRLNDKEVITDIDPSGFYFAEENEDNVFSFTRLDTQKMLADQLVQIQMQKLYDNIDALTLLRFGLVDEKLVELTKKTLNEDPNVTLTTTGSVLSHVARFITDTAYMNTTSLTSFNRLDNADNYFKEQILASTFSPIREATAAMQLLVHGEGRKELVDFYNDAKKLIDQNLHEYVKKNAKIQHQKSTDRMLAKKRTLSKLKNIYEIENGRKIIEINDEEKEIFYNPKINTTEILIVDSQGSEHKIPVLLDKHNNWHPADEEVFNIIKYKVDNSIFLKYEKLFPKATRIEHNTLEVTANNGENFYFLAVVRSDLMELNLIEANKYIINGSDVYYTKNSVLEKKVITKKINEWHFEKESVKLDDDLQMLLGNLHGEALLSSSKLTISEIKSDGFCYDQYNGKYKKYKKYKNKYYKTNFDEQGVSVFDNKKNIKVYIKRNSMDVFKIDQFLSSLYKKELDSKKITEALLSSAHSTNVDHHRLDLLNRFKTLESKTIEFINSVYDPILDPVLFINNYIIKKIENMNREQT